MRKIEESLGKQLLLISGLVALIISLSLFIILPKLMKPIYEESIYQYLELPLYLINDDFEKATDLTEVAYIIVANNRVITTNNLSSLVGTEDIDYLIDSMTLPKGKLLIGEDVFYYNKIERKGSLNIAITDDNKIKVLEQDLFYTITPIFFFTFFIISAIVLIWSKSVVSKIGKLKDKIDNIRNDDFDHDINFSINDEINVLATSIEEMRNNLIMQEDFRNQVYQNISHDFKTPITVIRSYAEAAIDNMHDKNDSLKIIDEQAEKLQSKVHSLLYLNKLNYLTEQDNYIGKNSDVSEIIKGTIKKLKFENKNIVFKTKFDKTVTFNGSYDMWEAVIDNILNNAIRYAVSVIQVEIKNNKITIFNDGPRIDNKIINTIFTPYKTGSGGQFGFGLSIVSKTVDLFGYSIKAQNERKGVKFIIE